MKTQAIFGLFLAAIFFFHGTESATFTLTNNCASTIWPASLTGAGAPQTTGWVLNSKDSVTFDIPSPWSGRFWARTQCTTDATGKFKCATGDCASGQTACNGAGGVPPVSLAEFTLAANNGQDFYDISLVDGFNLPLSIAPQGGSNSNCPAVTCQANLNAGCPLELQVKGSDGSVVACNSACSAFNQPQYCCTGAFGSPDTCPPTNYSNYFKGQCPQAYSYAYDDKSGLASCIGGPNYIITFCP
ncbi:Thaumatin [Corchorus capsularis]|uniref:Thaumatin n=1 Tax=Corchorus capsularis TaxID=210143 RepID=A0A1R3IGW6_COCAP|nr:Thaumatin [Corchorus capsularis]